MSAEGRSRADEEASVDLPAGVVDAHMHLWDLSQRKNPWLCESPPIPFRYGDYAPLRTSYLAEDYRRDAATLGIAATVYIEAEWDPTDPIGETAWISALSEREGFPNAVVVQAWLDHVDAADTLRRQSEFSLVRGVRHKPASAPRADAAERGGAGSMDDPRWRDGYALLERYGLHFELQTPFWHLDAAGDLARDFPSTIIVLNHTGLPADRSTEGLAAWRRSMSRFAEEPNTRLKVSGLGVRGETWSAEANRPVIRDAIGMFGVDRAMFASNFPVDSLVGRMADIFTGFSEATRDFAPDSRSKLFRENALAIYRIAERS